VVPLIKTYLVKKTELLIKPLEQRQGAVPSPAELFCGFIAFYALVTKETKGCGVEHN